MSELMSKNLSEDSAPIARAVETESRNYGSVTSHETSEDDNYNVNTPELEPASPIGDAEYGSTGQMAEISMDSGPVEPSSNFEIRGISINPLSSGYMVKVGCQSVAVESTETLIKMLDKYLSDPSDFERKWYSKNVRNRLANIL